MMPTGVEPAKKPRKGFFAGGFRRSHTSESAARDESEERFERLMERYATLLHSVVAQHCPHRLGVEATEIEQEARVRLWRALGRKP